MCDRKQLRPNQTLDYDSSDFWLIFIIHCDAHVVSQRSPGIRYKNICFFGKPPYFDILNSRSVLDGFARDNVKTFDSITFLVKKGMNPRNDHLPMIRIVVHGVENGETTVDWRRRSRALLHSEHLQNVVETYNDLVGGQC